MSSCNIGELDKVLNNFHETENASEKGKWPILIDPKGVSSTSMRYQNVSYMNVTNPQDLMAHRVRMSVLRAIRYGSAFVIDLMSEEELTALKKAFDDVKPHLFEWVLSREVLESEKYEQLIKSDDPVAFTKNRFQPELTKKFNLIFITRNTTPPSELDSATSPILIEY